MSRGGTGTATAVIGIPSSNHATAEFGSTTAAYKYNVYRDDDEEDPLGLLVRNDGVDDKKTGGSSCLCLGPPGMMVMSSGGPETSLRVAAADCYACDSGDPLEVIDAVLRSSKAVRDRVSSRQVSWNRGT